MMASLAFTLSLHFSLMQESFQIVERATVRKQTEQGRGSFRDVAFSPDGKHVVAVGGHWDGRWTYVGDLSQWETTKFEPVGTVQKFAMQVECVAVAPDSRTLAIGCGDWRNPGEVVLWDRATQKTIAVLKGHAGRVHSVSFSPDGKLLATCGSTLVGGDVNRWKNADFKIWSMPEGKEIRSHTWESGDYRKVRFSPDGLSLALGGHAGRFFFGPEVQVWNVKEDKIRFRHNRNAGTVESLVFTPDGKSLVSGDQNGGVISVDMADDHAITSIPMTTYKDHGPIRPHNNGRVLSLAVAPDGKTIAAALGSYNRGNAWGELHFIDVDSKKEMKTKYETLKDPITSVAFSPDGKQLVAAAPNQTLVIYDIKNK